MKADKEPDKKAAKRPVRRRIVDRGEPTSGMEPMLISESSRHRAALSDVVLQLTQRAAALPTSPRPDRAAVQPREGDELLLFQSDRRPQHASRRHPAGPLLRREEWRPQKARPPARGNSAHCCSTLD